ncbi:cbb3-type cytochrome oxidase assembly protein CcoS [Shewanella sp. SR44-3]|uniref:cbb3-type cytochrome oxidase assembly protein CcoS n=1 Tax=Shewanella sp. SR44-3 TaxID=2760936 RepID=UPI0015F867FD|nr:cbb3-type cytochrome oxidase assembly protein CcoS [Shewanella sp. SR44-3]MBB1267756.1 cbb3-type cytochrome oxidase assembly protein CcoS [Shewanella sp. SR44-3]
MSIIYVLIPIAMLFVAIAVAVFFWAVKSEQFDDLDRQSVSILFDDDLNNAAKTMPQAKTHQVDVNHTDINHTASSTQPNTLPSKNSKEPRLD